MRRILDILSVVGTASVVFGLLCLLQLALFGWIPGLKETWLFGFLNLRDLVFGTVAVLIMIRYFKFYLPSRTSKEP